MNSWVNNQKCGDKAVKHSFKISAVDKPGHTCKHISEKIFTDARSQPLVVFC